MARRKFPKTLDELFFALGGILYFISLIPIARLLGHVIHLNSLGLCVGGLGFASLGLVVNKGRINERVLLHIVVLWLFGLIVWASIG
ncbi:hypothetical protein [Methanomassiliicoccus luminyensis]|jgi:hypothetical protein|uniref:hypothetical protein n=1 Tax=Methanomassiliicoccus luminyensis TaxID=1080712 RepID=UPI00036DBE61|nr:hypothetical protein [Methanomassiliicoccus luminyensis]